MKAYRLSAAAIFDLEEIYLYSVVEFGEEQADRYHSDLEIAFEMLAMFPGAGQAMNGISPDFRLYPKGVYFVVYRSQDDSIEVVRVFHQAEDWIDKL